ncbi:hypothetical protein BC332_15221 [Capsicum chinense]|nr:hypothetical protein BC332_15221 [Capsicum chinense]
MPFFLTLRSVQILSDPKVIDGIKIKLFGATTIRGKIILEGGLVAVDNGSGSGASVGANDALLAVFKTKIHYDYDHTSCTNFSLDFATSIKYFASKCQDFKAKHDGVINAINALTTSVKKITSKRGVIPSKRISYPYTPLDIKVDVTIEATAEEHNITIDNPSTASKEKVKVEPVSSEERNNYPFEGFNISSEAPKKLTQLINDYSEWIGDGLLKHHADRNYDLFITAYTEYLSDGLQVPNDELDAGLIRKRSTVLLWKYREAKVQNPYTSDIKDPRRPKSNFTASDEEKLIHIE